MTNDPTLGFTIEELKTMLAERDIEIFVLKRELQKVHSLLVEKDNVASMPEED